MLFFGAAEGRMRGYLDASRCGKSGTLAECRRHVFAYASVVRNQRNAGVNKYRLRPIN